MANHTNSYGRINRSATKLLYLIAFKLTLNNLKPFKEPLSNGVKSLVAWYFQIRKNQWRKQILLTSTADLADAFRGARTLKNTCSAQRILTIGALLTRCSGSDMPTFLVQTGRIFIPIAPTMLIFALRLFNLSPLVYG